MNVQNLFVATATDGLDQPAAPRFLVLPVHPGEDAAAKQEDDYWRVFNHVISNVDAIHFIAGTLPPRLSSLEQTDLTEMVRVLTPASSESNAAAVSAAQKHNQFIKTSHAENARKRVLLADYKQRSAQALYTALDASLRPKAGSLLSRLMKAHRDAAASNAMGTDVYDGHAMVKAMRLARAANVAPARARSFKWHEEQYRAMQASILPDHCSSQDYADKCNLLTETHLPYFRTIRLEDELLSSAFLEFLPANLRIAAGEIEMSARTAKTFGDPDAVKAIATTRVGMMADPSLEHARLACSLGVVPSAPPACPISPSAGVGVKTGGALESDMSAKQQSYVDRMIAAAIGKMPGAPRKDADASNRQQKIAERNMRGRLPDGKRCKSGTCNFDHDVKHPGKPCFSDPRVEIIVSKEASERRGYLGRLRERRAVEGTRLGVEPKPIRVSPANAAPATPLVPANATSSFDGLDDWGGGGMSLGAAAGAAPANPLMLDGTPVVMGAPVFYDAAELEAALGCPDADEYDDESAHVGSPCASDDDDMGSARDVVGWSGPGDEGDVQRHSPSDSQWWFIQSPDSGYRDVRLMSHGDFTDLDAAGYTLKAFGRSAAAEVEARSHMASVVAPCDRGSPTAAPVPKPLPPAQDAERAEPSPAPATPPAPHPRSYQGMRLVVDALRPSSTKASITGAIRDIGLGRDVVSPATGGDAKRTRLSIIDDARHALGLPLLVDVDPVAVRTFLADVASRSTARSSPAVPMGEPVDGLVGPPGAASSAPDDGEQARIDEAVRVALEVAHVAEAASIALEAERGAARVAEAARIAVAATRGDAQARVDDAVRIALDAERGAESAHVAIAAAARPADADAAGSGSVGGDLPPDPAVAVWDTGAAITASPDAVAASPRADASGVADGTLPPDALVDVRLLPIFPAPPSRAAVVAFVAACAVVLVVACASYSLGGSTHALAVTGASVSFPAGAMMALRRVQHGGTQLFAVSPSQQPLLCCAAVWLLGFLLEQFITHSAWVVGCYLARVAWRCVVAASLGATRALRCSPKMVKRAVFFVCCLVSWQVINVGFTGADAAPTAARVQRVRRAVEAVPMPASFRRQLYHGCAAHHNVAFINMLGAESAAALACDLGHADPTTLPLWDTGAAINASVGKHPIVPGSIVANTTYVSTANGLCLPPSKCTQLLKCRQRGGGVTTVPLRDSVCLDSCQHTLCAGGKIAAEDGLGLMLAPYDGDTFLFLSFTDRELDIPLVNVGVLVLPDASSASAFPISRGEIENSTTRAGENIHQTFSHRDVRKLRHMPKCTHAPEPWTAALDKASAAGHCQKPQAATIDRVPLKGKLPSLSAPGDLLGIDSWSHSAAHIHGGQKAVLGTYDAYSRLDRSYLMHAKSDASGCLETHLAWNNSLGVRYKRANGDNAPDLIKGESEQVFRRWGCHITSSSPYEPRQNGAMERRFRQHGQDMRSALAQSNFLDHPSGVRYWWYAWRDAEMKSWCIPFERNGTWACPWQLHTGHRPNPTVYRPFGMLCYAKQYSPSSKAALQGRECRVLGYSSTQKGYLLLEIGTLKRFVSPHVHFVWGSFPGLKPAFARGLVAPASGPPRPSVQSPMPVTPPAVDWPQGGGHRADDDEPPPPDDPHTPRTADDDYDSDGDWSHHVDDDDSDEGLTSPISSRLTRGRKVAAPLRSAPDKHSSPALPDPTTELTVPDGVGFVLYLYGGGDVGEGSVAWHLRQSGVHTVTVDVELGGYAHDATVPHIQRQILDLAARPSCLGVLSSIPCGSWSAVRYVAKANAPGVERRLPHHARGVPRNDGSLAPSVVLGNATLDFAISVSELVISHGGFSFYESPVSRAKGSPFAIAGREDHASMWDDPVLSPHLDAGRYQSLHFDQCCTREHPCAQKTTQLTATGVLHSALRKRFGHLRCRLPNDKHVHVPGGPNADGQFKSSLLARYSPAMNRLICESVVEAISSGTRELGGPLPSTRPLGATPQVNRLAAASPLPTLADRELQAFHDAGYTIKLHPPDHFLGCNITPGESHSSTLVNMKAYVEQLAVKYLPRPLHT